VQVVLGVLAVLVLSWWLYRRNKQEVREMLDDYRSLMETGSSEELGDAQSAKAKLVARLGQVASSVLNPPASSKAVAPVNASLPPARGERGSLQAETSEE
jgi:hypothetical protein